MAQGPTRSARVAALLAAPLCAVVTWLALGAIRPSSPPWLDLPATPNVKAPRSGLRVAGLPPPECDLPSDRLHERVDGAEDFLRSHGCTRLLAWRLGDVAADLEVYLFETAEGARTVFARDAGTARSSGPGDEASADAQSVSFRRGRFYVRLIGDPEAPADAERLLRRAERVDAGLVDAPRKAR